MTHFTSMVSTKGIFSIHISQKFGLFNVSAGLDMEWKADSHTVDNHKYPACISSTLASQNTPQAVYFYVFLTITDIIVFLHNFDLMQNVEYSNEWVGVSKPLNGCKWLYVNYLSPSTVSCIHSQAVIQSIWLV